MEDSIQMPQNNDGNRMAVHLTLADPIIGTSENVIWKNVALASDSIHNNATYSSKAAGDVLRNSSNCTTLTAPAPPKAGLLHTNRTIGAKRYTISYDTTDNGNRLKSTVAQKNNATPSSEH
jgi:hypothetical protein